VGREQRCHAKYETTSITLAEAAAVIEFVFLKCLCWLIAGSDEQKFLEASMAYVSGNPIMTDKEFDELKMRLKVCHFFFIDQNLKVLL